MEARHHQEIRTAIQLGSLERKSHLHNRIAVCRAAIWMFNFISVVMLFLIGYILSAIHFIS